MTASTGLAVLGNSDGWALYSKRLEKGTFELPTIEEPETRKVVVDAAQLAMILQGIDLRARRRARYRRSQHGS